LNDEILALTRQIEDLKQQLSEARRKSPSEPIQNYQLRSASGELVALGDLFADKDDLLVIHNMGRGCVYCTMWADGLVSILPHLESRTAVVVISPDDPATQHAFAASRNWPFRMISAAGTTFIRDLDFADDEGNVMPGVSALHREPNGSIVRTGRDEFGPGDDYSPPWRFFDLLKGGAGDWEPKYQYGD
jgi:predicted dithiol-disulfide oxidoreductase (DUF899 family)